MYNSKKYQNWAYKERENGAGFGDNCIKKLPMSALSHRQSCIINRFLLACTYQV